jgi:ribosomal protein S18 acetylase RimI-like enzyme
MAHLPSSPSPTYTITRVRTPTDLSAIKLLFTTYASTLPISLSFQNFAAELATLPATYAPPTGELFLARDARSGAAIGCVALKPLPLVGVQGSSSEMKRLFVAPEGRGNGLGSALVEVVLEEASKLGYDDVRLDTLPDMESAKRVYRAFGFEVCESYYETPVEGTVFMRKALR